MLSEKILTETLLICQSKRKAIQAIKDAAVQWDTVLEQEETALRTLSQVARETDAIEKSFQEAQLSLPGMGLPSVAQPRATHGGIRRKDGKKPDVQVIEEILRELGPLHVTDLVPALRLRGVSLNAKKKPTIHVRDKMVGSKRFHLFGNNVWGLPGQELTEKNGKAVH